MAGWKAEHFDVEPGGSHDWFLKMMCFGSLTNDTTYIYACGDVGCRMEKHVTYRRFGEEQGEEEAPASEAGQGPDESKQST